MLGVALVVLAGVLVVDVLVELLADRLRPGVERSSSLLREIRRVKR